MLETRYEHSLFHCLLFVNKSIIPDTANAEAVVLIVADLVKIVAVSAQVPAIGTVGVGIVHRRTPPKTSVALTVEAIAAIATWQSCKATGIGGSCIGARPSGGGSHFTSGYTFSTKIIT